jgi:hypothetical protein
MEEPRFDADPAGWARRFHRLGFFRYGVARHAADPASGIEPADGPEEVARLLLQAWRKAWPGQTVAARAGSDALADLWLLSYDPYGTVVGDEESDVYPGDRLLQRLVEARLPRISRGAFIPSSVDETWRDDWDQDAPVDGCACQPKGASRARVRPAEGCPHFPVHLSIEVDGKSHRTVPLRAGTLDLAFIQDVNGLVDPAGPGLYAFSDGGQGMYFAFLRADDARALVRDRGWTPWHSLKPLPPQGHPTRPPGPVA